MLSLILSPLGTQEICLNRDELVNELWDDYGEIPKRWIFDDGILMEVYASSYYYTWTIIVTGDPNEVSCIIEFGQGKSNLPYNLEEYI